MKFKKFDKSQKSTFGYWFWHWFAFNYTAFKLKVWQPKYLFHDIEKPWLKLIWRDYIKVHNYHRSHSNHHLEYGRINGWDKMDWQAAIIDWECSNLTKSFAQLNARQTIDKQLNKPTLSTEEKIIIKLNCYKVLDKLGL